MIARLRPAAAGVWGAGVGLGLALGILSWIGGGWTAAAAVLAVLVVGAYYVRTLGAEVGVLVLLIVANAVDHFLFKVGPLDLRAEQVAVVLALGVLAAGMWRARSLSMPRPTAAEWLLLAWLGCGLVSSVIASPDRRLSAKVLVLIAVCTLGFFVPRRLINGPGAREKFEVVLRWLLIVFATESAFGTFAYLLHVFGPTIAVGPNPASGHLEAYGTLWEQNVFGAFAAAGAVAWVYLGPARFRHAWVGLALCAGGLIDSLTRAAWLAAAAVGALGLAVPSLRKRLELTMVGVGLLGGVLVAVAAAVVDMLGQYTVPVAGGTAANHQGLAAALLNFVDFIGRINQLSPVLGDIRGRNLVLGRGIASFEALHQFQGVPEHVASLPLLVLNDTGIVGLVLMLGFAAAVFIRAWSRRHDNVVVGLGQMAIVIALANLATQTTELMVGWLLIGILIAATDLAPAATVENNAHEPQIRAA